MKAFLFFFIAYSSAAFPATTPVAELQGYFDNAKDSPALTDFPDINKPDREMSCFQWHNGKWNQSEFALFTKTQTDGGYPGKGPLFSGDPGKTSEEKFIVYKSWQGKEADNVSSSSLEIKDLELIWTPKKKSAPVVTFRKNNNFIFYRNWYSDTDIEYGYCWYGKN